MNVENMKILSIDDNKTNLLIIESYAKILNLEIESFLNPKEALEASFEKEYDLVIVDYMMPEINGLEFIQSFRQNNQSTPIIMLTAVGDDMNLQIKALEYGANDFLSKPINAPAFKARIINMLKLRKSQLLLQDKALLLQDEVKLATIRLKESEYETLQMLGKTAEFKDPETNAHTQRVAYYCKLLARAYGLDENLQDIIFYASPFHDLGKIGIPDNILLKPGKLDDDEFSIMKNHAKIGYEILKGSKSKYLKAGGVIAYNHHEKYDGTGYPNGLKGESIPIFGRITAVADVFDALTSSRPYKKAWSLEEAFDFLIEEK
ncbi:two-component system response regulator c-di-GMP phosphodiesterase, RpfG family [Arcobacter acticola]|uniref:Two-component system response regulator c-di-GMP phosphodiesterase, RpfG family n=1 Tax=Arcobacter acticola TaxID=1849015 RepID=A0A6M8ETP5_9BACT|nr:HD domain-containing phosphohydrolase [Arcobacter acticola]QKE27847.1 two-component system response regulator c-di-GMP phosphodiesterase, RpfG family [Arcobacter acticola]